MVLHFSTFYLMFLACRLGHLGDLRAAEWSCHEQHPGTYWRFDDHSAVSHHNHLVGANVSLTSSSGCSKKVSSTLTIALASCLASLTKDNV